jgi:hypothetical protein
MRKEKNQFWDNTHKIKNHRCESSFFWGDTRQKAFDIKFKNHYIDGVLKER